MIFEISQMNAEFMPGARPSKVSRPLSEDCNSPYGRPCSPADLKRETNKAEPSPAGKQMQVDEVLIMCKAQLPADLVHFPVR